MALEDDEKPIIQTVKLDLLGVAELRRYIGELQSEISRVEAEIQKKQAHRSGAEALFKR